MTFDLAMAISRFGHDAQAKLTNPSATGEPEDQLRAPLETLFGDMVELCGFPRKDLTAVGESSISSLKTRPDYAIALRKVLVGFVEIKAPGKGADPRKYKGHDKEQWEKLQSLPNLLYTDGNAFSLWRSGELAAPIVHLKGDIESSGHSLSAPRELISLFENFYRWEPIPPKTAQELAKVAAKLCRLLRDEVTEQLGLDSRALTALATDWRALLFPEANDKQFADGYAQAVTFGLLMARARDIALSDGLDRAAKALGKSNSLIGAALRLLTDDAENDTSLNTSLGTLTRVLDAVNWPTISKGEADTWLYFYEDFLAEYDNDLRKLTGSYYTPPQVVNAMVRLVDEALRTHFGAADGFASPQVKVADPAVGTGTFPLGILRRIAETAGADGNDGLIAGAIEAAIPRLFAFEMQLGPFAVAQLRIHAELLRLMDAQKLPKAELQMYVTDTLGNPFIEQGHTPLMLEPLAASRRSANKIKREQSITVVIGNPPYKEKAKGRGGWIEEGDALRGMPAPLNAWQPPKAWGVGAHAKHLRNLYVYFWRWATWKVFDQKIDGVADTNAGIVCFITVAGFLNGPGFQKMRDYLRRTADGIWVIDCSPDGHQPDVPTRIFQGVQQPVCIVLVTRSKAKIADTPAPVKFTALPLGNRELKFEALTKLKLKGKSWVDGPTGWRDPFLPAATGAWAEYPALDDFFAYNGSGVMPGRTWIIAPDAESLRQRWNKLIKAKPEQKEALFVPHLRNGVPGDKHINKPGTKGFNGHEVRLKPVAEEKGACIPPTRYAFRSFDRQWIIPDNRVINQSNPELWLTHSPKQLYLTALTRTSPTSGPAFTFSAAIPDLDHYKGSFGGRVFPLWRGFEATEPNLPPKLTEYLAKKYKAPVTAEDVMAYLAAVAANPAYTARFQRDLAQPGLRIPLTAKGKLFAEAVELGRRVIWLQTFGERCVDSHAGRPADPPRLPKESAPRYTKAGAIPADAESMPDEMHYNAGKEWLFVGTGHIENVSPSVWNYEVSGKRVLTQWFSYRKKNRERPIIGDRRPPSKLCDIQSEGWPHEYTVELLNVLHVLGGLVALETAQADLLKRICDGTQISAADLKVGDTLKVPGEWRKSLRVSAGIFDGEPNGD